MAREGDEIDFSALRETFRTESQENLAELELATLALEERAFDAELVETMFRDVHTIKGNARVVGAEAVAHVAHSLEELLEALRGERVAPSQQVATLVLSSVDALRGLVERAAVGDVELGPEEVALAESLVAAVSEHDSDLDRESPAPSGPGGERRGYGLASRTAGASRTIRVPVERLDRLMDLVGEIAVARGRLTDMLESGRETASSGLLEVHRESDRVYLDLQELVMKMRMVPLGPLFHEYHRPVRDLAIACGRAVTLRISGEDVEVDTGVVERLRDPLTHLLRNAVSHGIEPWGRRVDAGKAPQGEVALAAFREAGSIVIQVRDDGAGLDLDAIRERAIEKGMVARDAEVDEADLLRLVFEPAFSTANEVTEISGRGVGLDVVKRNLELLRGTVAVDSARGKGTTITLRFPLTLAIIGGFRMTAGEETYVIPLDTVVECIELPAADRVPGSAFGVTELRGKPLPFLDIRELFGLRASRPERMHVVVVRHGELEAGLAGDRLLGEGQVVIKPVGRLFQGLPGLAGTAILGNGRVAFVLDVGGLLEHAMRLYQEHPQEVADRGRSVRGGPDGDGFEREELR